MSVAPINNHPYWEVIDILNTMGRPDRLCFLDVLQSGQYTVTELTQRVYGDHSNSHLVQASRALAPMRRLGLIGKTRAGRNMIYELTDLGHKTLGFVHSICHERNHDTDQS